LVEQFPERISELEKRIADRVKSGKYATPEQVVASAMHALEQEESMPRGGGGGMESYGATVLRIFLGVIYVMHAYLAAFVYGPDGMAAFQTDRRSRQAS
jgi:hypothetical protein